MSYSDLDPEYYEKAHIDEINRLRAEHDFPPLVLPEKPTEQNVRQAIATQGQIGEGDGYGMQFADPDWQPDPRRVVKLDLSSHDDRVEASKRLFAMSQNPWSDFVIDTHLPEPADTPIYDSESSHWIDVPFKTAWLFYGLFTFMGQLIVFGISTILFPQMLELYIMWGIACLLSLPFLSYWWTKYARYRHYRKLGRTHGTHHTRVY